MHGECGDLPDRFAIDSNRLRAGVQPSPEAGWAWRLGEQFRQLWARIIFKLLPDIPEARNQADKGPTTAAAVENFLPGFFSEASERLVDVDRVFFFERIEESQHGDRKSTRLNSSHRCI